MITDDLVFRRQYIIGPRSIDKFPKWIRASINGKIFLTIHPDLEFAAQKKGDITLFLLGFMLDPYHAGYGNDQILCDILKNSGSFADVVANTAGYGGRFAIIYADKDGARLFHDPAGFRQIFYCKKDNRTWAGSLPHILAEELDIREDRGGKMAEFLSSRAYSSGITEHAWAGEQTLFAGIRHLLPNHYLDLQDGSVQRYWPQETLRRLSCDEAIAEPAEILQGLLKSAVHRYKIALAVTAGWDSRVLLAASRPVKEDITYFILKYPHMDDRHNDISVPTKLFYRLGLKFNVIKVNNDVDRNFLDIYKKNTPAYQCGRKILGRYSYWTNLRGFMKAGGAASEIARSSWRVRRVSAQTLAMLMGYRKNAFVIGAVSQWLDKAKPAAESCNVNILDLFYWEQRMGNWGAMNMSESDIALEEFHPFNCRKLLAALLSVDKKFRGHRHSKLYHLLIERMWPEVLSEPINPATFKTKTRNLIRVIFRRAKESCPFLISAKK